MLRRIFRSLSHGVVEAACNAAPGLQPCALAPPDPVALGDAGEPESDADTPKPRTPARRMGRKGLPVPLEGGVLRFLIPDSSRGMVEQGLRRAHLLGQDNIAVLGKVRLEGEAIVCEADPNQAVGLCLQVEAGDCGVLMLQTCLLPRRERPYLLSLELARHRVMQFLVKLEDWLEGAQPPEDPMRLFEGAQREFMRALTIDAARHPERLREQDDLARGALCRAIDATESLSLWAAKAGIRVREHQLRNLAPQAARLRKPLIAIQAPCEFPSQPMQNAVRACADAIALPLAWSAVSPEEGAYEFAHADAWAQWAAGMGVGPGATPGDRLAILAGPIVDLRAGRSPNWARVWRNDYESLREIAFEHLQRVCARYARVVSRWTPLSGVNQNDAFELTVEQMLDLTRLSVMAVRKFNPHAKVHLEIDQPFGESASRNKITVPPLLFAEMVVQQGVQVDAIDLCVLMGDAASGHGARDVAQLSDLIDRYSTLGKPVAVSLCAPSAQSATDPSFACAMEPGIWRGGGWDEQRQADWLAQSTLVAAGKLCVCGVTWRQLIDADRFGPGVEMSAGGLLRRDGSEKPALGRFVETRRLNQGAHARV